MQTSMKQVTKSEYAKIHVWLRNKYGKAKKCESCGSKNLVQWALKRGKIYKKDRSYFKQLCAGCHKNYDARTKRYSTNETILKNAVLWAEGNITFRDFSLTSRVTQHAGMKLLALALKKIHYEK